MVKEISQAIIFILSFTYICAISFAELQTGSSMMNKLELRLNTYKDAFRSGDYTRAASCVSPNMINKIGGKKNFSRLVHKFTTSTIITLKPSLMEFSKPGEIVSYDNMYISVIRQIVPITTKGIDDELKDTYLLFHPTFPATIFDGMDGVFKISAIAYSEDEGNTWFLTGGNKMSLSIENIGPEILEKVNIPVPAIIFGEDSEEITLYRQNKQWVRSASGKPEGVPEESIILTIGEGEHMDNSQSHPTKHEIPDDSLDAYIYIEEHPDEYSNIPGEITSPEKEDSIKKGYKSKQTSAKDSSHSVFVTNNSRTYHKSSCPELGTGVLLEFNSANDALKSGGVACEKCIPQ